MTKLSRRSFLEIGAMTTAATAGATLTARQQERGSAKASWFQTAYRRAVIDMHIPDWDEKFLSQLDPAELAARLVESRAQSIVLYCQSHVGLFNFPTKVGQQHRGLDGRNVLKDLIDRCHANQIAVVLYTSLIFDRWAGDQHPEWRIRTWDDKIQGEGGRHAVLCVNSPYREYVGSFVQEICENFDFEGIRFDMTFWPWLCYCQHCRQRFSNEVGGEIPTVVNWLDEKWVAFQRCRERWLVEFAELATSTVKNLKPAASVEHQSSTYPLNWMFGVTAPLAEQNDFLQGDFYGDQLQGSFVRKLLENLTPNRPFGYETSFSVSLRDHTAMKSAELLEAKAAAAIADSAAFIFIDAIDPIGTVNPRAHQRMGRVFDRLLPYYEHLGGERVADVGIYYSLESKFSFAGNGRPVSNPDTTDAHTESAMQCAARLISCHIPFTVITKKDLLTRLRGLKLLILPNVNMMDEEECTAISAWVRGGGKLLASGGSSAVDKKGALLDDFRLADCFGVKLVKADWQGRPHYIAPTSSGQPLFPEFDPKYPAFTTGYGFTVTPLEGAEVLATRTLPWPAPDGSQFSSIHSDPPWLQTDEPEIIFHRCGAGAAIYTSSLLENLATLEETYIRLIHKLHHQYSFVVYAPACVEATLFSQPERNRLVLSLVNFQDDMPNLPIDGIDIRLSLGKPVQVVKLLPVGGEMRVHRRGDEIAFRAPRLETLAMFAIELGERKK